MVCQRPRGICFSMVCLRVSFSMVRPTGLRGRSCFFLMVRPTGLEGFRFSMVCQRARGDSFFNGPPTGRGVVRFSMVCPTRLPRRPVGRTIEKRNPLEGWSAQRVCGVVRFSMVRPTRLEGFRFSMVCPTAPGGFVFQWFAQRVCGVGVGFFFQWSAQRAREGFRIFFFNGPPNGPGRGFGLFFSMVWPTGPGGFVFKYWFAQRVCGVGVGFFKYSPNGPGGIRIFFFNGLPNGPGGIRFSMVRPTRLERFRIFFQVLVCPTALGFWLSTGLLIRRPAPSRQPVRRVAAALRRRQRQLQQGLAALRAAGRTEG